MSKITNTFNKLDHFRVVIKVSIDNKTGYLMKMSS
jgi:hypothetical protein